MSYLSPVSPKGERQFVRLLKRLIDKELQELDKVLRDLDNTFRRSQEADKPVLPALGGDRGGR